MCDENYSSFVADSRVVHQRRGSDAAASAAGGAASEKAEAKEEKEEEEEEEEEPTGKKLRNLLDFPELVPYSKVGIKA